MEEKRLISKERGEKVAEENGIKFYETSAKENVNIEHAFITVKYLTHFFGIPRLPVVGFNVLIQMGGDHGSSDQGNT